MVETTGYLAPAGFVDDLRHELGGDGLGGGPAPRAPLGSWTLLDPETILASPRCSSPFPNDEARLSQALELFTLVGERPLPGETSLDLGASRGGWTWVLARLGAHFTAFAKAPLVPAIARLPNVTALQQSAFALDPGAVGRFDWLFAAVICYPSRLYTLVERWMRAGIVRRFVCTVKFQGTTDFATAWRLAQMPGARLLHLCHNKHELTWLKPS